MHTQECIIFNDWASIAQYEVLVQLLLACFLNQHCCGIPWSLYLKTLDVLSARRCSSDIAIQKWHLDIVDKQRLSSSELSEWLPAASAQAVAAWHTI